MKLKQLLSIAYAKFIPGGSLLLTILVSACNNGAVSAPSEPSFSSQPNNTKTVYFKILHSASDSALSSISAYDKKSNTSYLAYIAAQSHLLHIQSCVADKCNDLAAPSTDTVTKVGITLSNSSLFLTYTSGKQINLARFANGSWQSVDTDSLNKQKLSPAELKLDADDNGNVYLFISYQNSSNFDFVTFAPQTEAMQQVLPAASGAIDIALTRCGNGFECFSLVNNTANSYALQSYVYNSNLPIGSSNPKLLNDSSNLLTNLSNKQISLTYAKQKNLLLLSNIAAGGNLLNLYSYPLSKASSANWQQGYGLALEQSFQSASIIANNNDVIAILSPTNLHSPSLLQLFSIGTENTLSYARNKILKANFQLVNLMHGRTPSSYLLSFLQMPANLTGSALSADSSSTPGEGTPTLAVASATQLVAGWNELYYNGIPGPAEAYGLPTIGMDLNGDYAYLQSSYGLEAYALNNQPITNVWNPDNSFFVNSFPEPHLDDSRFVWPLGISPSNSLYAFDGEMDHLDTYTPDDSSLGVFTPTETPFSFPYDQYTNFVYYPADSSMKTVSYNSDNLYSCTVGGCTTEYSKLNLMGSGGGFLSVFTISSSGYWYLLDYDYSNETQGVFVSAPGSSGWTKIDSGTSGVTSFAADDAGNAYAGWGSGVIEQYNGTAQPVAIFNPNDNSSILSMFWDNNSSLLYYSTSNGFWSYSPTSGVFTSIAVPNSGFSAEIVALAGNGLYSGGSAVDAIEALVYDTTNKVYSVWVYDATPQ